MIRNTCKAHVVEITEARTVAFMKAINFLVVRCREWGKAEDGKN